MRRLLLVLTIITVTCGLMSAGAATASAATCTAQNGANYYPWGDGTGYPNAFVHSTMTIGNCSDVVAIQWVYNPNNYQPCPTGCATTGFIDYACNCNANGRISTSPSGQTGAYADSTYYAPAPGAWYNRYDNQQAWWYGACRQLSAVWWWRIKNATYNTWGPLHIVVTQGNNLCF